MQKKRWFALALALVLVMSLLPVSSLAAPVGSYEDVSEDAWYAASPIRPLRRTARRAAP